MLELQLLLVVVGTVIMLLNDQNLTEFDVLDKYNDNVKSCTVFLVLLTSKKPCSPVHMTDFFLVCVSKTSCLYGLPAHGNKDT